MQYSFDIQEAVDYGLEEAIMIWNFRFWIVKNKANNKHQYQSPHDNVVRTWTYNSVAAEKGVSETAIVRMLIELFAKKL